MEFCFINMEAIMISLNLLSKLFLYVLYNCNRFSKDLTKLLEIVMKWYVLMYVYIKQNHTVSTLVYKIFTLAQFSQTLGFEAERLSHWCKGITAGTNVELALLV